MSADNAFALRFYLIVGVLPFVVAFFVIRWMRRSERAMKAGTSRWSPFARDSFKTGKIMLIGTGAWVLIGMGIQNLKDGTVGLGLAFLVYLMYHAISWIVARRNGSHRPT